MLRSDDIFGRSPFPWTPRRSTLPAMTQLNGGQHTGQHTGRHTGRRLTVAQAAEALGVTVDAIRSRIKRGSIAYVREGGRVYVLLGDDQGATSRDQGSAQYAGHHDGDQDPDHHRDDHRDELVEELRNRVRYLEEESRRKDHLLAAALERIPAIEAPRDAPHAPETVVDDAGEVRSHPATEEAQEGSERPPWWRRWFG